MPHRQDAKTTQLHNQSLHSPRYRTDRGQDLVAVCTQEEVYRKLAEKQRKIEKLRIDLSSGNIKNAQNNDKIIPDARTERKSITGKQTSKAKANLEEESNQKMNIEEGSSG